MSSRQISAAERVAKWDRRYTSDHVKSIIDAEKSIFLQNNTASTDDLVYYELLTKQCLNAQGISVADASDYLAFSREVWAKKRRYAGETLNIEVAVCLAKWVARGRTMSVLEAIRDEVYNIPAPSGP